MYTLKIFFSIYLWGSWYILKNMHLLVFQVELALNLEVSVTK